MSIPFEVKVNGEWSFEMDSDSMQRYDQARLSPESFHVIHDSNSFDVQILEADFNAKTYKVSVNGKPYDVAISDPLDQLIATMGFEIGASKNVSHIQAPMPGLILDIQVSEGDEVKEGDALLVLEAMKMENVILSPRAGTIAKIAVKKGAAVDKKNLLIEFK
jgi:biotin carboxyl carrier protein